MVCCSGLPLLLEFRLIVLVGHIRFVRTRAASGLLALFVVSKFTVEVVFDTKFYIKPP